MTEFFDKLKKGMNIETKAIEEENPLAEEPGDNPEAVLTSIPEQPADAESSGEAKEEKPARKKTAKKKITRKKTTKAPAEKPLEEKKIKVKQESSLEEEIIDRDIFQKEGQLTVDVFETDKDIIIQSVVAGVDPEDIDISIEKDMVSIKGKRERRVAERVENFFYQECFWGRFTREVVLPSEVDKNKAEASMKNGVLTIRIPKINTTNSKKLNINIE